MLLAALDAVPAAELDVIGAGPEASKVAAHPRVRLLGWRPPHEVRARMARAAEAAGADALSLVNTFLAMAIDPVTRRPRISNVTAGLSGPAIKPIAVRMVYEAAHAVKIPVIGIGGISTAEDVVEFLLAGASAVEVGTASFWDPRACERLVGELERWCLEQRVERVAELTGGMRLE